MLGLFLSTVFNSYTPVYGNYNYENTNRNCVIQEELEQRSRKRHQDFSRDKFQGKKLKKTTVSCF